MSTTTPYLGLALYDSTGDQSVFFSTFRAVWGGTATTSNFYKIDNGVSALNTRITNLETLKGNPAEGTLWNGIIQPSVTSNNLTLALKTFAGADPSVSDVVYVTLGGVIHAITTALSITMNAGSNWFALGSNETATLEQELFAYLGFNATDGVVLGTSRIPYAKQYGDFSATSTNSKYAKISTISTATTEDPY